MSVYTGTQQGNFVADGSKKILVLRADVDWLKVYNITIADADQTTAVGVEYYWQRGFAAGRGIEYKKSNAANAANLTDYMASGGFTLINSTQNVIGASTALTAVSTAATPVVTTASTAALSTGQTVRLFNVTNASQLGGIDFTITVASGTTFTLDYMAQLALAGTTGTFRVINFDPIFYPPSRFISAVVKGAQTEVRMTVTNQYTLGQKVKFSVPDSRYGMVELNEQVGTIIGFNTTLTNSILVDIDSSSYTAFTFPANSVLPFTPAMVFPVGENTAVALANNVDVNADATRNTAFIGIELGAGADGPAGATNDVIYWVAGKSFSVDNEV